MKWERKSHISWNKNIIIHYLFWAYFNIWFYNICFIKPLNGSGFQSATCEIQVHNTCNNLSRLYLDISKLEEVYGRSMVLNCYCRSMLLNGYCSTITSFNNVKKCFCNEWFTSQILFNEYYSTEKSADVTVFTLSYMVCISAK